MKRYAFFLLIGILVIASLACSITFNTPQVNAKTGPTQTMNIDEPAPSGQAKLDLGMGAGTLNITGGGTSLVSGTVRYNVDSFKPTINRNGSDVTIKQTNENLGSIGTNVINDWNLKLGNTPMDLTINAGAYEGTVDLTGVPLTHLQINDGASKSTVSFKALNPQVMDQLTYKTGASQVDLEGLGYANFKQMTFGGGAGSYTLDFTGKLQQDAHVTVTSGVSSVKIIVPIDTPTQVEMTGGLNNVDTRGTWTVNNKVYSTTGSGPALTITVEMGVGNLELISQ